MKERTAALPGGVTVAIRNPRHQQKWWLRGLYYEEPLLSYIREHYRGGTFIDAGACIGNHTLYFAALCDAHVIAIEPVESNMAHLQRNVELSGLGRKVTTVAAALAQQPGRGRMVGSGSSSGKYWLADGDEVDVTTLDQLTALARYPVRLIKLDIQWSEVAALDGAHRVLSEARPVLFVELTDEPYRDTADGLLAQFDYVRGRRFGGKASPVYEYTSCKEI